MELEHSLESLEAASEDKMRGLEQVHLAANLSMHQCCYPLFA